MLQIKVFARYLKGFIFDIEPNDIKRPRGSAKVSVNEKMSKVVWNPPTNLNVTDTKSIPILTF